jgi:type I restriction enzyme S subunit
VLQAEWQREGVPFYRAREIVKLAQFGSVNNDLFISEEHYQKLKEAYGIPQSSDIMLSAVGTIGKSYVVKNDDRFYYKDASVLCLQNIHSLNSSYIQLVLSSLLVQEQMYDKSKGTTVDTITIEKVGEYTFPLPPLAEQVRIVAAVGQWFEIVDDLESNKHDLQETILQTKAKILELAIHGNLVSHDPDDEPATELLKRIAPHAVPCDTSHYGNLPKGWCATTFEYLSTNIASKKYQIKQSEINESGKYPVISQSANFIEGYSDVDSKLLHMPSPIIVFGDHTRITKYIDFDFIVGADGVKILQPLISARYFYYLTQYVAKKIENRGYSRHYSYLSRYIVPLPPRVEQERIALRIEELFDVLDKISADL